MSEDQQLRETLKGLAGPVVRSGVWASIEARAGVEPWDIGDRDGTATEQRARAATRKPNLRLVVYACVAVALVAAMAVGSLEAVKYLGKDEPILVISDDTLEPVTTVQTTPTTVAAAPSWQASLAAGDDKALVEKALAVYSNQDVAGAKEIFAEDANLYWNFAEKVGAPVGVVSGIEDISALVADYPSDVYLYGDIVYTLDIPVDAEDIGYLTVGYKGARYIFAPVCAGRDLFMEVLEIRDGKIQNQYVMAIY